MNVWDLLGEAKPPLVQLFDPLPQIGLEPGRTALLVVDMDRGSVLEGTGLIALAEAHGISMEYYKQRLRTVIPNIARLQQSFRETGLDVAYTKGMATKGGHKLGGYRVRPLATREPPPAKAPPPDPRGREIIDALEPVGDELVITKNTPGPFGVTNIDHALRMIGTEILVVTGIVTDQCVEATVRGAFDFGYQVILVEDACATVAENLHKASLRALGDWFCRIHTTEEVVAMCRELKKGPR